MSWLMEKAFLISQLKVNWERVIIFVKFQKAKEMITQLAEQQINITGNLANQSTIIFLIEEAKEKNLDF